MTIVQGSTQRMRFRRSGAVATAALLAFVFAVPFSGSVFVELDGLTRLLLSPAAVAALLIPLATGVWALRSGVDADPDGLTVRAALGARRLSWAQVRGFETEDGKTYVSLTGDVVLKLPAVRPVDLPQLAAAGGQKIADQSEPEEE